MMKKSDFFYELPKELIAQEPSTLRDESRLMLLNSKNGEIQHKKFYDILDLLNPGDCLILNDTKVLPARLLGIKAETGAAVEFLLLSKISENTWEALAGPGKKAKKGDEFIFDDTLMKATVKDVLENGNRLIEFEYEGVFIEILEKIGKIPLPHYITAPLADKERYQTVYSKEAGSAAAPTAGLHFTKELLEKLEKKGIKIGYVTLHVGLGTFRPVKAENIHDHKMHSEQYHLPAETAILINETKAKGKRVICVGTTSCRTLESAGQSGKVLEASEGWTDIFIYPGYKFKCVDALITNFHLPESTLIMLVSAFAGHENTMKAYRKAVLEKYRFFSFGDCTFIY